MQQTKSAMSSCVHCCWCREYSSEPSRQSLPVLAILSLKHLTPTIKLWCILTSTLWQFRLCHCFLVFISNSLCVCSHTHDVGVDIPHHMFGNVTQFSPLVFTWVQKLELWPPGLCGQHLLCQAPASFWWRRR